MATTKKQKLCWNCDGRVSLEQEDCPFCSVYLSPTAEAGDEDEQYSLAPPYRPTSQDDDHIQAQKSIPQSPFASQATAVPEASTDIVDEPDHKPGIKEMALTMILLSAGSLFFLFSIFMFLFGRNGTFSLRWETEYWYIYAFLAIPLMYFGCRGLAMLKDE